MHPSWMSLTLSPTPLTITRPFSPPFHPYCISPAAPYLHFTNLLLRSLCLLMSPSFSCVSPKIDDSPPQGEWACLKMHEVMRPSFLLLLSLSLSLFFSEGGGHLWKRLPNNPRRSEATSKSHSLLPSQLLSGRLSVTYDDQLADSVINDAAEDPRLINKRSWQSSI